MNKDLESLYERAVEDTSFRQEFVDSLNPSGIVGEYARLIVKPKQKKGTLMGCVHPFLLQIGFPVKVKINIYPLAFSREFHPNVHDFLSTLVHHEGRHMFQDAYGKLSSAVAEVSAWENVLRNLSSENSPEYARYVRSQLEYWHERI